jgi:hypothetical protein
MDAEQSVNPVSGYRQHWLCLFTLETWEVAMQNNFSQAGFTTSRLKTAGRIRDGDLLHVYLLQRKVLCGCLIASGSARLSPADSIYPPVGKFPVVLSTTPGVLLPANSWIPIEDLVGSLMLFRGMRKASLWRHALRNSPRSLRSSDGELILKNMKELI